MRSQSTVQFCLIITVATSCFAQVTGRPLSQPGSTGTQGTGATENGEQLFRDEVAPILIAQCLVCHGGEKTEGGYSVKSFNDLVKPGDSEKPAIVRGEPANSELWRRLTSDDEDERMPAGAAPLSNVQIESIRRWINAGAEFATIDRSRPLIELASKKRVLAPEHYPQPIAVNALAICEHKREVMVAGYAEVTRWDIGTGELIGRIPVAGTHVAAIDLSVDEKIIAVSSGNPGEWGAVELIPLEATTKPRISLPLTGDIAADLAFSPDASRLLIAGHDGSLRLVELLSTEFAVQSTVLLTPHADTILAVAWSSSGAQFLTASRDRTAKLFNSSKSELDASYDRHERAVGGVGFVNKNPVTLDETGRLRVMVGDDSDSVLADRSGLPRYLQRFKSHGSRMFVPAGKSVRQYDIEQLKVQDGKDEDGKPKQKKVTRIVELKELLAPVDQWIASVAIRGQTIAAGTQQGKVLIWNLENNELSQSFLVQP